MFALQMSGTTVYSKAPSVRDLWRLLRERRREKACANLCFSDSLHLTGFVFGHSFCVCASFLFFFFFLTDLKVPLGTVVVEGFSLYFSQETPRERSQTIVN